MLFVVLTNKPIENKIDLKLDENISKQLFILTITFKNAIGKILFFITIVKQLILSHKLKRFP